MSGRASSLISQWAGFQYRSVGTLAAIDSRWAVALYVVTTSRTDRSRLITEPLQRSIAKRPAPFRIIATSDQP